MLNRAYTNRPSQKRLINSADFPWKHFAAGPILPMAQYITIVKSNDFNISNNNFNLPVTKFALFPTDFDIVRVNNCACVKIRSGRHLIFPPD